MINELLDTHSRYLFDCLNPSAYLEIRKTVPTFDDLEKIIAANSNYRNGHRDYFPQTNTCLKVDRTNNGNTQYSLDGTELLSAMYWRKVCLEYKPNGELVERSEVRHMISADPRYVFSSNIAPNRANQLIILYPGGCISYEEGKAHLLSGDNEVPESEFSPFIQELLKLAKDSFFLNSEDMFEDTVL